MPFMHRRKPANIARSEKRNNKIIHELAVKALDFLSQGSPPYYIRILPTNFDDPSFKDANPELSFTTYAVKELNLTWFEVEQWLDEISLQDQYKFYLERGGSVLIDECRRYYQRDFIRLHIFYRPKQL